MDNQEAIETIKLAQSQIEWDYPMDYATAFDMAISALQAQDAPDTNVGDMIYRQAAIDALKEKRDSAKEWYEEASASGDEMMSARAESTIMTFVECLLTIKKLPSAQPEPCEDAVSRKDVQSTTERSDWFESSDSFNDFLWALYALPPVTPKRKTGKWNFIGDQMFECTECGTCYTQNQFHQMMVRITDPEFPNFCPNCGADMRGEQDG